LSSCDRGSAQGGRPRRGRPAPPASRSAACTTRRRAARTPWSPTVPTGPGRSPGCSPSGWTV